MRSVSRPREPARRRDTIRRSRSSLRRQHRCRPWSEAGGLCGRAGAFALRLDRGRSRSADRSVWSRFRPPPCGSWPRGPFGSVRSASSAAPCSPATRPSTRRASCAARPRARRDVQRAKLHAKRCRRHPMERRPRSTSAAGLYRGKRSLRRRLGSSKSSADQGPGSIFDWWPHDFSLVSLAKCWLAGHRAGRHDG